MKTDVQIAQEAKMIPISQVADNLGIKEEDLIHYGKYKAKVSLDLFNELKDKEDGKLILVQQLALLQQVKATTIGLSKGLIK